MSAAGGGGGVGAVEGQNRPALLRQGCVSKCATPPRPPRRRCIFISTTLSRPESLPRPRAAAAGGDEAQDLLHVGFWRNPRRFNVRAAKGGSRPVLRTGRAVQSPR